MSSAAEAETALAEWKSRGEEHDAERDPLVRAAHKAGLNINRIHKLSGVSRTTIYQILGLAAGTGRAIMTESKSTQGADLTSAPAGRLYDGRGNLKVTCPHGCGRLIWQGEHD